MRRNKCFSRIYGGSQAAFLIGTLTLIMGSLGCRAVEDIPGIQQVPEYQLTLDLHSITINNTTTIINSNPTHESLDRDPFAYLYITGDPERLYIVATKPFPGAEEQGVFHNKTLSIDVNGRRVELKSHLPLLGKDPIPAFVKVEKPVAQKAWLGVFVSEYYDINKRTEKLLKEYVAPR